MAEGKPSPVPSTVPSTVSQRLDKWLWCARLAKTRTQAAALVSGGKIRVNRLKIDKPALAVKVGDVITASLGPRVRVLAVKAIGDKRGPPSAAQLLFDDLTAPAVAAPGREARPEGVPGQREAGSGRPTKRDRRAIDRLKGEV